ncbi:hypothetical protein HPP92_023627 [Vanilla planifolia]|uniref:Uncharacterized protein n=1 Tax=Vanilla planifolia TaxID=51239 RepID=A0A835PM46_VANPL|nr:hypothetical protein HPP92_023627 [Vanilla planifolia]
MYWENPMQYLRPPPRAQIKVVLLGDQGVGKTSLVKRYVEKSFRSEYKATLCADFVTKEVAHEETTLVTVQIWDTAGEESFNSLETGYHRDVDGCVLVFDINKRKTFANIDKWYSQFLEQVETWDRPKLPFLLIGNKIDKDLGVSDQWARDWCATKGGYPYIETSANDGRGVGLAFECLVNLAFGYHPKEKDMSSSSSVLSIPPFFIAHSLKSFVCFATSQTLQARARRRNEFSPMKLLRGIVFSLTS